MHGSPIDNAQENWAMWMYLSWAFAPDRHARTYLASALVREGLSRHGAFHVLRTQVARRPGNPEDVLRLGPLFDRVAELLPPV